MSFQTLQNSRISHYCEFVTQSGQTTYCSSAHLQSGDCWHCLLEGSSLSRSGRIWLNVHADLGRSLLVSCRLSIKIVLTTYFIAIALKYVVKSTIVVVRYVEIFHLAQKPYSRKFWMQSLLTFWHRRNFLGESPDPPLWEWEDGPPLLSTPSQKFCLFLTFQT